MILAVFVIALAFRAIAEYQIRIIRVGAAAYRAAMAPALLRRLGRFPHLSVELLFAPDLLRIIFPASCHQEIDQEVQKRHDDRNAVRHASEHQTVEEIRSVKNRQPFRLDRDREKQIELHIRERGRESEKQREIQVIRCQQIYIPCQQINQQRRQHVA